MIENKINFTKIISCGIVMIVFLITGKSFSQNFEWAKKDGGISTRDMVKKTIFDNQGNMYAVGTFGGLNGGTTQIGNFMLTSFGRTDMFLAKYNHRGNLIWVKQAGSIQYEYVYGLELDNSGNIYVSGIFGSSLNPQTYSMSFGNLTVNGFGGADLFIAKYDSSGNVISAESFGSPSDDQLNGMSKDSNGNFYFAGGYKNTISFGNFTLTNNSGIFNSFIIKINSQGNCLWAKNSSGTQTNIATDICSDASGNLVVCGFYYGTLTFGNITRQSNGENDIYAVRYDPDGNPGWLYTAGGVFYDYGLKVDIDFNGNVILSGSFESVVDFGNDFVLQSSGGDDTYICKLNSGGIIQWAKQVSPVVIKGFTGSLSPSDAIADSQGNYYLTGHFVSAIVIESDTMYRSPAGLCDIYILKYSSRGEVLLKKQIFSGGTDVAAYSFANSLSYDFENNIYLSGYFSGRSDFDNIILDASGDSQDLFIAKISSPLNSVKNNFNFVPGKFLLDQNYPNPFNPVTSIRYSVSSNVNVKLAVYDATGREISILKNEFHHPGTYTISFAGKNLPSGVYFYSLFIDNKSAGTKKMILLK